MTDENPCTRGEEGHCARLGLLIICRAKMVILGLCTSKHKLNLAAFETSFSGLPNNWIRINGWFGIELNSISYPLILTSKWSPTSPFHIRTVRMWWKWSAVGNDFLPPTTVSWVGKTVFDVFGTHLSLWNRNVKCWMKFPGDRQKQGSRRLCTSYWSWSNELCSTVSTTIFKCLLRSHVILPPHFTLGIELWACELNQIYKGQSSKNWIVIDFTLYHKLDVDTLMSHMLYVSILMIHEGVNHAMVTSPSCKVHPLRLHPKQSVSCRREYSGVQ